MPATAAKPMIGVRLPAEQVATIRRLAGGEPSISDVIRRLIAVGLQNERKETRCSERDTER